MPNIEEAFERMEDGFEEGDVVVYSEEASDEQVKWGSNDDPRKLLELNKSYEIESVEVHSWHTKLYLKGIKGKFNSVNFTYA